MRRAAATAAALLAALTLAACGDSPEDEARDDGEQIGQSVRALFDAQSATDAGKAIDDLRANVADLDDDVREHVKAQVETQRGSIESAARALASGDTAALQQAAQEIRAQADTFRSGTDSIANEFWRGVEDGFDG